MIKPKLQTREYLDYSECAKYIANKLGVEDLRDFAGRYTTKGENVSAPYQDFWHFLCDGEINNGAITYIGTDMGCEEEWQQRICNAFVEEFGEEAPYLMEW